ncbi:hypothetical protein BVRB_7g159980 [Beta vulgaris subsp. vulgaris]|nr:hypothetical protein BVRB_7g159980 [Beta vulgaris subsp. vulgaris]
MAERESITCHCTLPVARRTSWTEKNPGRRFMSCKFYEHETEWRGCGFFRWIDEGQTEWQKLFINQLMLQKRLLEGRVRSLEDEVSSLQGQRRHLVNDYGNLEVKYKTLKGELKLKKKANPKQMKGGLCKGFMFVCVLCMLLIAAARAI